MENEAAMPIDLHEWEIWHTYATYLDCAPLDLISGAKSLVDAGVADCVMLNDGTTFWNTANGTCSGITAIDIDAKDGSGSFTLHQEEKSQPFPSGFALEAWGQSAYFMIGEQRVLGETPAFVHDPYLRAYLGKCVVYRKHEDDTVSRLNFYPILLVHQSGVMILELRMIGPESPISLPRFIDGGVNLFREHFDQVEVSPGLAQNATAAYYRSTTSGVFKRARLAWSQARHNIAVRQLTKESADDSFSFKLAPWSGETDTLQSIVLSMFHTCAYLLIGPREGIAYVLFGQRLPPSLGEYWSGRPYIHLIQFQDQQETARENEERHGSDFARILARCWSPDVGFTRQLPKDARLFEDYNAYITSASTLWVWSKEGLRRQESWRDPNRGNFIYDRQRVSEVLEYGYMLQRGLYHRIEYLGSTAQVMAIRRNFLSLQLRLREASHSGEIRDLLEHGWKEFGLPLLKLDIESALALRESDARADDAMRATRVGWAIAIVFGFVAVPGLADQIVLPAWKMLNIWPVNAPDAAKLIAGGVSLLLMSLVLTAALNILTFFTRRRH
jgi:hypothetical protein